MRWGTVGQGEGGRGEEAEAESGARQGRPGRGQYQPYQVGLSVDAQLAVELLDVRSHRRLCPVCSHDNIPDAVTGGQGGCYPALGSGEAECRGEAGRINLGAFDRINEQHEGGDALSAEVGPVRDRADMQGEREPTGRALDGHGPAGSCLPPMRHGGAGFKPAPTRWRENSLLDKPLPRSNGGRD